MCGGIVDGLMVIFSVVFNVVMALVFVFRAQGRTRLEAKTGPLSNSLLLPFVTLWLLNLIGNGGLGRLVTPFPAILFLSFDLWYRTLAKRKPVNHPNHWPLGLYIYLLLFVVGGIMLNGYAFLVSLPYGFLVLSTYYSSLIAYSYYQYSQKKSRRRPNKFSSS